ncbi:EST/SMG-like protein 1 [Colletotrichum spaethianum]|uniref:EST/SMG-like protein 1 n=1 Tax=Colletotrichum spaethianum TaxID=700344 RepID=A0AA37ULT9_9PEZI|nr:EST/SMG-like protein 1 [Colletotrichum spaethianum]GKT52621.1 EST/SMG-like protein 1 [Colletotrichum spaethianum]
MQPTKNAEIAAQPPGDGADRVRVGSPSASEKNKRKDGDHRSNTPKRSRARQQPHTSIASRGDDGDFQRGPGLKSGRLWTPEENTSQPRKADATRSKDRETTDSSKATPSHTFEYRLIEGNTEVMIKQPETRPISQEQLVAEVKGIYAGLVMVESKCIEVVNAQSSTKDTGPKLNNEQWQALIALHRTLLHEHHDFFLASQHPSASPALRRLASKYAMPARMWRHGIHSFLELLRHRLPASLEHMLTFIYLAYSMMALLYETVPTFEDTWIECLGDLGRYRMAIENENLKDREVWNSVSRHWYSKSSDKAPTTGRLYHHLAILARPNALQELSYHLKSLCVPVPFLSARESIMTLFDPHLDGSPTRLHPVDAAFVRAHGILFSGKNSDKFESSADNFIGGIDSWESPSARGKRIQGNKGNKRNKHRKHSERSERSKRKKRRDTAKSLRARNARRARNVTSSWLKKNGHYISIALGCALLEYGSESNVLMLALKSAPVIEAAPTPRFLLALEFAARVYNTVFRRIGDRNVLPYLHVALSFLYHMSSFPEAMGYIEAKIPWRLISMMLNALLRKCPSLDRIESEDFPRPNKETPRPLPEDFAQRGLLWVDKYYPDNWFPSEVDDDDKYFEVALMVEERQDRCLWLGCRLASSGNWLTYDKPTRRFGVPPQYDL